MADRSPVWQGKEWQEAKKRLLQKTCQQCSSTLKLSLVHLWKPPRYAILRAKIEQEIIDRLVKNQTIQPFDPLQTGADTQRQGCPGCESINLRRRKTKLPPYRCGRCGKEFSNPILITVRDNYLFQKAFKTWKDQYLLAYEAEIEREIKLKQSDYNRRYRSGEGTTTFCQKCAFLFTQKGMILCQSCKVRYHKKRYEKCYDCNNATKLIICEKCNITEMEPQPGDINICQTCYEQMWKELTDG